MEVSIMDYSLEWNKGVGYIYKFQQVNLQTSFQCENE